jgi:hypothetical protein
MIQKYFKIDTQIHTMGKTPFVLRLKHRVLKDKNGLN